MTKNLTQAIFNVLLITTVSFKTYGAAYQIFPSLAYENPAALNTVKKAEFTLGATDIALSMNYSGRVGPLSGVAKTDTNTIYPYMRLAYRFTKDIVASFDVTHPALNNISYPQSSIVSAVASDIRLIDTNFSPKISYQVTKKLALGLGFDANDLSNVQVNFVVPPYGNMRNKSTSWAYGYDLGLSYILSPTLFANISYYSILSHSHIAGTSTWGPLVTNNFSDNVTLPGTLSFNMVKFVTPKWLISATAMYIQWNTEQNIRLNNTAIGNIFIPLNYHNTWNGVLATRYQLNDSWAIKGAIEYDGNAQATRFRPIAFPTYSVTTIGSGVEYAFNKAWSAQFTYAYSFSNPPFNTLGPTGPIVGKMKIAANIFDFGIKWKI